MPGRDDKKDECGSGDEKGAGVVAKRCGSVDEGFRSAEVNSVRVVVKVISE